MRTPCKHTQGTHTHTSTQEGNNGFFETKLERDRENGYRKMPISTHTHARANTQNNTLAITHPHKRTYTHSLSLCFSHTHTNKKGTATT